jgi:subtilisin family serine protease
MMQRKAFSNIHSRRLLVVAAFLLSALTSVAPIPLFTRGSVEFADDAMRPSAEFNTRSSRLERGKQMARLGIESWHRAGSIGAGIKIAILDSGFRGYRAYLGDVLPAAVKVRSFRRDGNLEAKDSQHGILCGEVVHVLAPAADLLFANWEPDEPEAFLQAVEWARSEGARIVSCSVIMPSWSDGEGGGEVHRKLARLMAEGQSTSGMLCFASAGNIAERHWVGEFRPAAEGMHDWRGGATANRVRPWGSDRVSLELYAPAGSAAFELSLCDENTGAILGKASSQTKGERLTAVVRFEPDGSRSYAVRVRKIAEGPNRFHLVALGAELDIATPQSSVVFPADGPEVIGVGAVDEDGRRLSYSSCGPNSSHPKPDLVAPVPFMTFCRSRPFAGTSAAAPQAAGIAAVLWSEHKTWSAGEVCRQLLEASRDLGQPGPDFETGYGRVGLPGLLKSN